jgi:hypothetical protein
VPDVAELLVARAMGRNLSKREGCLVQGIALLGLVVVFFWFFTSDLFMSIITAFSDWYAHQLKFPVAPLPSQTIVPTGLQTIVGHPWPTIG